MVCTAFHTGKFLLMLQNHLLWDPHLKRSVLALLGALLGVALAFGAPLFGALALGLFSRSVGALEKLFFFLGQL